MLPSSDATILNYLNDGERGRHYFFLGFWRPPMPPSPNATIFLWRPLRAATGAANSPMPLATPLHDYLLHDFGAPPSLNATILNNLNDREGGAIIFFSILAPPMPPSPTPQYLTILMTEKGGAIISCRILPPPLPRRHNT